MNKVKFAVSWFSPEKPIEKGTRVAAANGWDHNNKEQPKLRGTVIERKRETDRWALVQFDASYCGSDKPTWVPCQALVEIVEEA